MTLAGPKLIYHNELVRLYHGDNKKLDMLADGEVQTIVTSPPYNISTGRGPAWQVEDWYADDLPEPVYQDGQVELLNELYRVTAPDGSLFYNHKVRRKKGVAVHPFTWIQRSPWTLAQVIVWDRGSTHNHQNSGMFWPQDEIIFWLVKGKPFFNKDAARFSTVWRIPFEVNSWHPAPFPPEIARRCIVATSRPGDLVLDPHSGSGTTVWQAQELNRRAVGIDIDESYLIRSVDRLAQLSMSTLEDACPKAP